jgi:cyclic nucleotide gated channel alpha 3
LFAGIITNSGRGGVSERLSASGTRLDSSSSPVRQYNSRNVDTVSSRVAGPAARHSPVGLGGDKRYSRDSASGGYANRTTAASSELDISRKTREARRRDIRSRLRLDRWEPPAAGGAPQHLQQHPQTQAPPAHGAVRPGAPTPRIAPSAPGGGGSGGGSASGHSKTMGCRWSFVFDPAGRLCYYWSMVVSLAFLYNFWVLIYR